MKLRQKTVLLILAIYGPLILVFSIGVRALLLRNHEKLEHDAVIQNLSRVQNTLYYDLIQLDALNFDWSAWDDTYEFVFDNNDDYREANLIIETFQGTRLSFIAIISSSNTLIYGQSYNHEEDVLNPLSHEVETYLLTHREELTPKKLEGSVCGYIPHVPYPMQISCRHIINSRNEGPSRGLLIMGRMVTPDFVHQISKVTQLNVELLADKRSMTPEENTIFKRLIDMDILVPNATNASLVIPHNTSIISGYMLINGIHKNPLFAVRVICPRDIYRSGHRSLIYLILYIIVISIVSGFILMELLEKVLVSRMIKLSDDLKRITNDPNTPVLLTVSQNDELTSMTRHVNHLLKVLSARRQALLDSEEKYRSFAEHFQGIAYRTDLESNPIFFHGAVRTITGYREKDFLHNAPAWKDIIFPEDLDTILQSNAAYKQQHNFSCERQYRILRKDGAVRWVHEYMQSIHDRQADPIFLQGAIYDITTRKENEEAIRQAKERLDMLTHHLQQVREDEASRIAQRIHDELGQLLMALKIDIKWLEKNISGPDNAKKQLETTLQTLSQIEACINNISTEIKPPVLDSLGLDDAVQWLISRFEREYSTTLNYSCDLKNFTPSHHLSTIIFRILQEALINCYRHANASVIDITIQTDDEYFILTINDNGIGIPADALHNYSSFGLNQMRERAEYLNAKIDIITNEQDGTHITVTVPLKNNRAIF